jgi:carotenoid cleavage dioxygenase-like enzyme
MATTSVNPAHPRSTATDLRNKLALGAAPLEASTPFRSTVLRGPQVLPVRVEGAWPTWLDGDLVRTAPAVFELPGGFRAAHWFDGLGMLFRFGMRGGEVTFRQALLRTATEQAARKGAMPYASFGTPVLRSFWRRLFQPLAPITDNVNVHALPFGSRKVALTEAPTQWSFDPASLELREPMRYDDELGDIVMIAHAHFDFARGVLVSVGVEFGMRSGLVVFETKPDAEGPLERVVVGRIPLRRVPYVHSFGLTPKHAVLYAHPLTVNPASMLWSNKGFIDHFTFDRDAATVLYAVDRASGAVRSWEAPAAFMFHTVHAFEDGEDIVLDVAEYPDAGVVEALRTATLRSAGLPDLAPALVRYRLRPGHASAEREVLMARGFEFPTVNYRAASSARHEAAWGARIEGGRRPTSTLVRWSASAAPLERAFPGWTVGEPLWVKNPEAQGAGASVLLSVGVDPEGARTTLFALDPTTLETVASAEVETPVPLGFHGSFFARSR